MPRFQSLPQLWLLSDPRNEEVLEEALGRLPQGSGFVFRHYHLGNPERRALFERLRSIASEAGHLAILSGDAALAAEWGADGIYGPPTTLKDRPGLLRLATAHNAREVALANRMKADGVFISPVYATRSHPGGKCLGGTRFRALAARAEMPVIALGGMNAERARELDWPRWGAIDGLS